MCDRESCVIGGIPMSAVRVLLRVELHALGRWEVKRRSESGHRVDDEQRSQCQSERKESMLDRRKELVTQGDDVFGV